MIEAEAKGPSAAGRRAATRGRLPATNALVCDNYDLFVIGCSPTERPADSILSSTARANAVGICFLHGASLPDTKKLLRVEGKRARFTPVESAGVISEPDVDALIEAAVRRSVFAKQRPRRKPEK